MNKKALNKAIEEIEEIKENTRLYNCLKRSGINKMGDIVFTEKKKIEKIRNLGVGTKKKLEEILEKYDLNLIGTEDFEKEITSYTKQLFPIEKIKELDVAVKNTKIDERIKAKLMALGFKKTIDLTTKEAKDYFVPDEYYQIKLYILQKGLATFEHPLYKYIIKLYKQEQTNIDNKSYLEKDIYEMKKLQQFLEEDINEDEKQIEEYEKELDKYITLKNEKEKTKQELEHLEQELKKIKLLYSELEKNKQKLDDLQKEKDTIGKQLIKHFYESKEKNNSK